MVLTEIILTSWNDTNNEGRQSAEKKTYMIEEKNKQRQTETTRIGYG